MAKRRLSDFSDFLNSHLILSEQQQVQLHQLKALIEVATMTEGFLDLPKITQHHYWSNLLDLANNMLGINHNNQYFWE